MGITTGHVFSDGDTVTAAKLNAMVNDATITSDTITPAMIKDDAIESRHISDGAITSNHITAGSVDMAALASGQTTEGYIIQTDSSGNLATLTAGSAGTVLVSGGAETAPSFTTVGAAGINAAMISDHDKLEAPAVDDVVLAKSGSAGVNKRLELQNLFTAVSGLTALTEAGVASSDEHLIIDGTTAKKITQSNLQTSVLKSVNGLSALSDTTVADNDVLLVYDTSDSSVKKIAKSDLGNGGSLKEVQTNFTFTNVNATLTDTITAFPSSNDSGVLVVYNFNSFTGGHKGNLEVTLPDAANYVSEGVKELMLLVAFNCNTTGSASEKPDVVISSTDSDGNTVYAPAITNVTQGALIRCIPFVSGSSHLWAVSGQL